MPKRAQRNGAEKPRLPPSETGAPPARERHTGEGSASALATLQRMERDRRHGRDSERDSPESPASLTPAQTKR